ncbi:MAG: ferredoxin [Planctomycetota bacterium]|nr:ferredoxin [Planctomycetota bacterium]
MSREQNTPVPVTAPPAGSSQVLVDPADDEDPDEAGPANGLDDALSGWVRQLKKRSDTAPPAPPLPELPTIGGAKSEEEADRLIHEVRRFHRGEPDADELPIPDDRFIPALLHPFRDPSRVRHDYPLFVFPPEMIEDERLAVPLADLLRQGVDAFAPGPDDARILKDNLKRLERAARAAVDGAQGALPAREVLADAGRLAVEELDLDKTNAGQFDSDLTRLLDGLPEGGMLLGLDEPTPLHLLLVAARRRAALRRSALHDELDRLCHKLNDLLLIDRAKEPERRQEEDVKGSVGPAATEHVDTAALARVLGPARGTQTMPPQRRERVRNLLHLLRGHLSQDDLPVMTVVHKDELPAAVRALEAEFHSVADGTVCAAAAAVFDENAARYTQLFTAMRMARLELADAYVPERHDTLLKGFDWEAFSRDELLYLPPVVALERAREVVGPGMLELSRLLLSGRPVQVLVAVQPAANPGLPAEDDPILSYHLELAYLGVSHREALVHQSSAARPEHLLAGYARSLMSSRASLHVIASGLTAQGQIPPLGAWLHAGAALEGRAHPLFHYDPGLGETWARRFDFTGNPQPEADWPAYELPCRKEEGEETTLALHFSFADFALMERRFREHFRVMPDACAGGELVTVHEYLAMPAREFIERIPYVWGTDGDGRLRRLVISRRMAFACRDRLSFWHLLQELAGVRNEYVEQSVARERQRLEGEFQAERERLAEAHQAELEQVRRDAAGEVLQRLARTLLQGDLTSLPTMPTAPPPTAPPSGAAGVETPTTEQASAEEAPAEAEEGEEEDTGPEEPWINSILCTTCNDCINLNPQMFVYNSNKQATIADPRAGTYAQLVEAAEKCPARCIHPGKPLNPDEPNLEELKKRAAKFN